LQWKTIGEGPWLGVETTKNARKKNAISSEVLKIGGSWVKGEGRIKDGGKRKGECGNTQKKIP